MMFLIESQRKRTSLSCPTVGAPEVQMHDFLIKLLEEPEKSESGRNARSRLRLVRFLKDSNKKVMHLEL